MDGTDLIRVDDPNDVEFIEENKSQALVVDVDSSFVGVKFATIAPVYITKNANFYLQYGP